MAEGITLQEIDGNTAALIKTGLYGNTTGNANTYAVILSIPLTLEAGLRVTVKINVANTGASTLNVNGLGAKSLLKSNGNAMASGNLRAGGVYTFVYDGTNFFAQGEGGDIVMGAGDIALYPLSGNRSISNSSFTNVYSVTVGVSGVFRISYTMRVYSYNYAYSRIYKNGVAYGTQRGSQGPGGTDNFIDITYTEDLAFNAGDTIEIWGKADGGSYGWPWVTQIKIGGNVTPFVYQ